MLLCFGPSYARLPASGIFTSHAVPEVQPHNPMKLLIGVEVHGRTGRQSVRLIYLAELNIGVGCVVVDVVVDVGVKSVNLVLGSGPIVISWSGLAL